MTDEELDDAYAVELWREAERVMTDPESDPRTKVLAGEWLRRYVPEAREMFPGESSKPRMEL